MNSSPSKPRSPWITFFLALIVAALAFAVIYPMTRDDPTTPPPAPPTKSNDPLPDADRAKLVGQWQRTDAEYVLDIRSVAADGKLDAAYLNPKSIHVSIARATRDNGKTKLFIELRDVGYPGSTYTLTYSPDSDTLRGQYYQAAMRQTYDIEFTRLK